ncbi:MAG: ribonuclease D [Alphaproteobacteria bacterium]|nr:ribonuclease D [Alphaproteobacteria bacterium]
MNFIENTETLELFCHNLKEDTLLAIDTEFIRQTTYWPKLCLIQIAGEKISAVIDVLSPNLCLTPLYDLLTKKSVIKIFHAARQDIEAIFHLTKLIPTPIADTQLMAMVCGLGETLSYEHLVLNIVQKQINKKHQYTDWSQRPLSLEQLDYALNDVQHLHTIYHYLNNQINNMNRSHWIKEEIKILESPQTYKPIPEKAWTRLHYQNLKKPSLFILQHLASWRETKAQHDNINRNSIIKDSVLEEIAKHIPQTAKALSKIRGITSKFMSDIHSTELLNIILEAKKKIDRDDTSYNFFYKNLSKEQEQIIHLFKILLKIKSNQYMISSKLICSNDDIENFILTPNNGSEIDLDFLKGWRYEVFGQEAMALKQGKLAMIVKDDHITLVKNP